MKKQHEIFALTSEIQKITGKAKEELTRDDLIQVILEKGIERITFHYTGIDGKIKELRIPITSRSQAELILTEGERIDGSSIFKGIVDAGKSDQYVVPQYSTAFLNPFDDKSLDIICRFFTPEGELSSFAPDNILRKASETLYKNTGLKLHALSELEFFLLANFENTTYPMPKQRGYHASTPYLKGTHIFNEMLRQIAQVTDKIKYAHSEVGYIHNLDSDFSYLKGKMAEQVEIEFLLDEIENAADHTILAAWLIRNVAFQNDAIATFYPKIDVNHAGNGLHFHNALFRDGKNMMADAKGELTEEAKMFIGGLCKYASTLNAFGNMCSASYLRLVPHQEAPTKVCWSEMNRSALIRVPLAWGNLDNLAQKINPQQKEKLTGIDTRQTIELRSPDGSANVHMLLAGITMAAEWGLTHKEESLALAEKSYVAGNIHDNPNIKELDDLATSCVESGEFLLKNRELLERNDIFPKNVIDYVAEFLHHENDYNLNKRLTALPSEERMHESRRIMHSHLTRH